MRVLILAGLLLVLIAVVTGYFVRGGSAPAVAVPPAPEPTVAQTVRDIENARELALAEGALERARSDAADAGIVNAQRPERWFEPLFDPGSRELFSRYDVQALAPAFLPTAETLASFLASQALEGDAALLIADERVRAELVDVLQLRLFGIAVQAAELLVAETNGRPWQMHALAGDAFVLRLGFDSETIRLVYELSGKVDAGLDATPTQRALLGKVAEALVRIETSLREACLAAGARERERG